MASKNLFFSNNLIELSKKASILEKDEEFNLINDEIRSINTNALSLQKDPRTKKKKQDVKNKKVEEIEI